MSLPPDYGEILAWIRSLPGPVKAVHEAGPTRFELVRHLLGAGIDCVVAAPSKLQHPCGDRVKTDAKDAMHPARLLRLGEITEVTIPAPAQEAARDLVRAREDACGDLMSARQRVSKLLLRQGIVYSGGEAWNGPRELWLERQKFGDLPRQLAYDASLEAMHAILDRRDRLDTAITAMAYNSEFTPVVRNLGMPARDFHADRVRPGCGDRGLDPVHRLHHRGVSGAGALRVLLRCLPVPGLDHQDRQHPTPAGSWSRRPGTTTSPIPTLHG